VHWARDAHEHNQIVSDILGAHGAKTLVKSKSMLTEECELRPFLERRGITVTETDLGERIQQLDNQPPAHIVGPAFQKTTQDIAEEFGRVYGSDPDRADPVYLARVMREHTRPLIPAADAGMTGANFAVAETGTVVTVTNEGNADLSGNVPKLRICSVGIEKVIPGLAELAVFIRLLTRSATGSGSPSTPLISPDPVQAARCTSCWSTTAAPAGWPTNGLRAFDSQDGLARVCWHHQD
jgi:L-lactate dehydrogenase complex protein LldF